MSEVIVLCPANVVTGGPELLHQFVHELRKNQVDAKILYYPFGEYDIPDAYTKYNIVTTSYDSVKSSVCNLIIPEVATNLSRYFNNAVKCIWWLSVDNYFKAFPKTFLGRIKFSLKMLFSRKKMPVSLTNMCDFKHLSQSQYGLLFLKENGIENTFKLTDYLNEVHLNNLVERSKKENIVAYNPKKGVEFTQSLIKSYPGINFVPIQNMTAEQVGELLNKSKVYIDFGEHPGKDRIPREAAMANCVIITGLRGSANNEVDLPIERKYKFPETLESLKAIGELIEDVFDDFGCHEKSFKHYKDVIRSEKFEFSRQTKEFIKLIN